MSAPSPLRLFELALIAEAVWPEAVESIVVRSSAIARVLAILDGDESGATRDEARRVPEEAEKLATPPQNARSAPDPASGIPDEGGRP
jgi:hypothetical protein